MENIKRTFDCRLESIILIGKVLIRKGVDNKSGL